MQLGCYLDLRDKAAILACKDAGADYIEGSIWQLEQLPRDQIISLAHLLRSNNLPLRGLHGLFSAHRLTGEWVDYQKIESYLFELLEKAAVFCPQFLVFDGGACRAVPDGFQPEYGMQQLKFLLQRLDPIFESYGVNCAILPCAADNLLQTAAEAAQLAEKVGSKRIGVAIDYNQLLQTGEQLCIGSKRLFDVLLDADAPKQEPLFAALQAACYDDGITLKGSAEWESCLAGLRSRLSAIHITEAGG